ncbi:MAG: histidinol dehydrogenase [Kiritimatiellae bacterium]|nr:histidinol dehydrogenase [Kiritimatiellia bacterium]
MTDTLNVRIAKWAPETPSDVVTAFLERPAFDPAAEETAREVLAQVRARGDAAVLEAAARFDGAELSADRLRVTSAELLAARQATDRDFRTAAAEAHKRIARFAGAGLRKDWTISTQRGGAVGEQFVPFDRVGVYVPGGAAPLVSTALMTATLAKVAGVLEIVACTPCDRDGRVDSNLLFALDLAGATEIFRIGGIQAVGAMAYGTETIGQVQKIVGPGGPYVTAAKRLVYGEVALDLVAGPSEIAILADETAAPEHVAADLISQAEHGTGHEKALLVTCSDKLAVSVHEEIARQTAERQAEPALMTVLRDGALLAVVNTLDDGMELCNRFAPEHLEIIVREPKNWLKKVRCAGAVCVGPWTPVVVGDFAAGPSHVLPTGGAARRFAGLSVDAFRRRHSIVCFTRADLKDVLPVVEAFGRVEGLAAHVRSAAVRFER